MPAAPSAPSPLANADVVDAEQLARLEEAYRLPATEPVRRPVAPPTRRAAAVAHAVRSGVTPLELFTAGLFAVLGLGLAVLLVLAFLG